MRAPRCPGGRLSSSPLAPGGRRTKQRVRGVEGKGIVCTRRLPSRGPFHYMWAAHFHCSVGLSYLIFFPFGLVWLSPNPTTRPCFSTWMGRDCTRIPAQWTIHNTTWTRPGAKNTTHEVAAVHVENMYPACSSLALSLSHLSLALYLVAYICLTLLRRNIV
jgi:hypothetical protein